jgi:hypothetical protein
VDWIRLRDSYPPRTWGEIGGVGVLVFLGAILAPIWRGVPEAFLVEDVVAFAGAGLAVLGFTLAWDSREADRRDPSRRPLADDAALKLRLGPNVEVYAAPPSGPRAVEERDDDTDAPMDEQN